MSSDFHIEVDAQQKSHEGERICGDVFLSEKFKEENRLIVVLSDGLGHGVKANVLATLTATMAMNFTKEHKDVHTIAEIIMNTLPVDKERQISYATFTILDIDYNGEATILEFDNPRALILRDQKIFHPQWQSIVLDSEKNKGKELKSCTFPFQKEDRIVVASDGVVQSGLGSDQYPFGWGQENFQEFVKRLVNNNQQISANKVAQKVVNMSYRNDGFYAKDDTSCCAVYFREPRRLLITTGPPYEQDNDAELAKKVKEFEGKKIISGATTGDIIARELGLEIEDSFEFDDPDLPPISYMDGVDLVTEGILTLSKVADILKRYDKNYPLKKGPADQIIRLLKDSDEIHFLIGTRINEAHQDPSLPVELEIRRTVVKRIAKVLEEKFLKEVTLQYI
ncbi:MAG: SpoIIE family protein phosphatase [Bacteroidales bacterium]|nr:SpoIIE family protein phosphatase [Bacteroidales bacterium]